MTTKRVLLVGSPQESATERMPLDLPLRCRCGRMRGVATDISPSTGFRFVCYCKDCQAFARFLKRADVLDPAGGTDIFQMPPRRVKLTAGTDAMRCLRLSNKVLRWYTDCCRTPIANTAAGPGFPVIGVVHSFMEHEVDQRNRRPSWTGCSVSINMRARASGSPAATQRSQNPDTMSVSGVPARPASASHFAATPQVP
jgi:hypothetical protein